MDATNNIFVFGSNLAGRHGKGAALVAKMYYGAKQGLGEGRWGNSYAIPTKDGRDGLSLARASQTLSLLVIKRHVDTFLTYAKKHPELTFRVTAIGTGLSGYKHEDIGPMFCFATDNCILPKAWRDYIVNPNIKYWDS
jgi:hypothetical protein